MSVVPATPDLAGATVELPRLPGSETRLRDQLGSIREQFLFTILDCPPSLGPLTVNALVAADRVLVPVQTEYFALEGLAGLLDTLSLIQRELNPRLAVAGMILTMHDGRTRLAQDVEREVREHFPDLGLRHGDPPQRAARRGPQLRPAGDSPRSPERRIGRLPEAGQGGGRSCMSRYPSRAEASPARGRGDGPGARRRSCRDHEPTSTACATSRWSSSPPTPPSPAGTSTSEALLALAESDPLARGAPARGRAAAGRWPV
ncbi:MAG: AAA family ATPase [Thermoleophilaceae bacterium]